MNVTVLTGGVGGSKLVQGLQEILPAPGLTAIVNTGDDFTHLGLMISPDIDTLLYTLSGKADLGKGWGRAGETWSFMAVAQSLGEPDWFALGDGDLALHVMRTRRLTEGETLSQITDHVARQWQIGAQILPMSDNPVATMIHTPDDILPFQQYFVGQRCEPEVRAVQFSGAAEARPAPGVVEAIISPATDAVLIAPSNPYVSIDPILAVPGLRGALTATAAPVIAVSPLVGGRSVKGPTDKIMRELGIAVSSKSIAEHYGSLLDGMLVDALDDPGAMPCPSASTPLLMTTLDDKVRVAEAALKLARSLA